MKMKKIIQTNSTHSARLLYTERLHSVLRLYLIIYLFKSNNTRRYNGNHNNKKKNAAFLLCVFRLHTLSDSECEGVGQTPAAIVCHIYNLTEFLWHISFFLIIVWRIVQTLRLIYPPAVTFE